MSKHREVLLRLELVELKIDKALSLLETLVSQGEASKVTLQELQTQVAANTSVEQSAITLIQNIAAMLAAAKTDPAAIQALADQLKNSADALSAAVVANTPAAPP
jgi:hypothetical protein